MNVYFDPRPIGESLADCPAVWCGSHRAKTLGGKFAQVIRKRQSFILRVRNIIIQSWLNA
jgi:hypothetical protein